MRKIELSQKEKILVIMAKDPTRWFYPYDFMRGDLGDLFVGYKASSRISELAHDYPKIFESEVDGKYVKRRLKMSSVKEWYYDLPVSYRKVLKQHGFEPYFTKAESLDRLGLQIAEED